MSSPKRRKLNDAGIAHDFQGVEIPQRFLSDVNAEVETEIALKEQLSDTLEARIAWAMMLQDSLKKGTGNASQGTFRSVALDALSVTEQTASHILQKDPVAPPLGDPTRLLSPTVPRPTPRKPVYTPFKKPAFLYIRSSTLGGTDPNDPDTHNHLYLLKCPGCARTAFTSLQGLLNHARLTHALEWGTHDECIRACAVVDNDLDVAAGIEVGIGPAGILPGLRTIFQRAVGGNVQLPPPPPTPSTPGPETEVGPAIDDSVDAGEGTNAAASVEANVNAAKEEQQPTSSGVGGDHLIKTLGFHSESPALAPFLGKDTIRREIKVWNEDADIDIFVNDGLQTTKKSQWKMPFTPRNFFEQVNKSHLHVDTLGQPHNITDMEIDTSSGDKQDHDSNATLAAHPKIAENVVTSNSRFHFMARIIITDRSLWIPPAQRPVGEKYTHKWMMSVDAPAYTHHITSILNSVRVGPSEPSLPIPTPPPTTSPPFVVVGFCDRPFLAKVELSFSGTSSQHKESDLAEQKVSFEHWVGLNPIDNPEVPVFQGQDQVLDVELDKSTILKPPQLGYVPLSSRSLWNMAAIPSPSTLITSESSGVAQSEVTEQEKVERCEEDAFELSNETRAILTRLVKQFPISLDNAKRNGIQPSSLPYKLPASVAYFRTLVMGRRKAIERARARAVQEAYNQEIHNLNNPQLSPLSVGDVFWWMTETGCFLREKEKKPTKQNAKQNEHVQQELQSEPLVEQKIKAEDEQRSASTNHSAPSVRKWCRVCGLEARNHETAKFVVKAEDEMESLEDGNGGVKEGLVKESYAGVVTLVSNQEECHIVPRVLQIAKLPNIDIRMLQEDSQPPTLTRNGVNKTGTVKKVTLDAREIVAAADPKLMLSIQKSVSDLSLSTFRHLQESESSGELFPIDAIGAHRAEIESRLAPTALLAHLTKQFIRVLVQDGLEVAKRDRVIASGVVPASSAPSQKGNRRKKPNARVTVLLTPTHILSGILTRGRGRSSSSSGVPVNNAVDAVILSSLSKLGIGVEDDSATPSCQGEGKGESEARVKLEE
ncbi:hypothetical protein JR316_0006031 [Psilocybe cubensis]|uniref:YEATS domain-containing protein n=2 Tax=Psilocybe cubensis TaxID=181762 RepID=A0A8H8CM70_PSICU|nr:hypothetical protein JR316_0006031 [Psilocybe cubensis]KAH9481504.1 hypothetical protein JR316_0006031 [Psilocybe cubensis]